MQVQELYKIYSLNPFVQTDTRKLKKGDLFFALKGPNFNGNQFAQQALDAGATYVIADEETGVSDSRIINTNDVLKTLQDLAKYHREQFNTVPGKRKVPFIAITGSNGKTTTKELMHEVLSTTYKTYTTVGNLNNHIGIPITLLSVKMDAEMVIIEMGANHKKEIEGYCKYTTPTHGLITNIGKAHLEGFEGEEGVRKGKGELFDHLRNCGGTAFIMNDYKYLRDMSRGIKEIITYGTVNADICGEPVSSNEYLEVMMTEGTNLRSLKTNLVGTYNLPNVLAAVTIGKYFNVSDEKIKMALENYNPSNSRSQLIEKGTNKIILDAYNANPSSMKAAVENFSRMQGEKKVLLLGGMMELGNESKKEHQAIAELVSRYNWERVVLVGGDFGTIDHDFIYFDNSSEAKNWLAGQNFSNTLFLVKGSRSIQMEKIFQ